MQPNAVSREHADKMLLSALEQTHAAARFYDTKAQIVCVGYILALNVVLRFGDLLPDHAPFGPMFFVAVWLIVIMPILQFGYSRTIWRVVHSRAFEGSRPTADRIRGRETSLGAHKARRKG